MNRLVFNTTTKFLLIGLGIMLVWNLILQVTPTKDANINYLYNIGYGLLYLAGCVSGVAMAIKISLKSTLGKALLWLGIGNASYAIGLFIWTYYNLVAHIEVPYPSLAEVFFLPGFILPIALGVIIVLSIYRQMITPRILLEGTGIFLVSCIFTFGVINQPDVSQNLSLLTKICNIAYPLGDTVLLTLAFVTLRIGGGNIFGGIIFLVIGLMFQVAADFTFTYRTAHEIYWNGDVADLLFTLSGSILSLAIIQLAAQFGQEKVNT